MQIEVEGRRAICQKDSQGRRVRRIKRTRTLRTPRPDGVKRQQIRQVKRGNQRSAHIGKRVPRKRAKPCLKRVDTFDATAEALRLEQAAHFPRVLLQPLPVLIHQDNTGCKIPRAYDAGLHVRLGRFSILPHEKRVPVHLRVRVVQELVEEADDLLIPPLDKHGDFLFRVELIKTDESRGIAQLEGQKVESRQHGRPGFLRQTVNGDHGEMLFPQTRLKSSHEVFFAKKGIQIHRRRRHSKRVHDAGDTTLEPGQQIGVYEGMSGTIWHLVFTETPHSESTRRAGVLKFGQRMLEALQCAFHVGDSPFSAGGSGHTRGTGIRQPGQHDEGSRNMTDVASKKGAPLLVQHARNAIRKATVYRIRIGAPCRARGIRMDHPSRSQIFDGGTGLHGDTFQLRRHGACCILSAHFVTREKRTVLLQHDTRRDESRIGQQIGQSFGTSPKIVQDKHIIHL